MVISLPDLASRIKARPRSGELQVAGDTLPRFVYAGEVYDPRSPWSGLFRGKLLIMVNYVVRLVL